MVHPLVGRSARLSEPCATSFCEQSFFPLEIDTNVVVPSHSSSPFLKFLREAVDEPIQPAETLDMIVGTSTGGIIAMALLAGNKNPENEKDRKRMTIEEVKQFFIE